MRLKAIELKGFKSFAQRTRIEFPPGISAIVGPNGCGKSNIIDAVRWVLGEQATGALRAKKMEDVIFNGTEHKARQNYAEVSLLFEGADTRIEGVGEELCIRRILHRSGESIYSIDGKDVRLRDVRELLMDTGIGVSGYSLISQGDIEDILSQSGFNRRKVFEEASGTSLLTAKKLEASRRLERVESNVERISDIYLEVESRIEPLKEASEKAARYLELKERMEEAELYYALGDYERYDKEASQWQAELQTKQKLEEILRAEWKQSEEESEAMGKELREREEEHDALRQRQRTLMEERDGIFLQLRLKEERKTQTAARERALAASVEEGESLRCSFSEELTGLGKEVEEKERKYLDLTQRLEELNYALQEKKAQLLGSHRTQEEREEELRKVREQLEALKATEHLLLDQKRNLDRDLDEAGFDRLELKKKTEDHLALVSEKEKEGKELRRLLAKRDHSLAFTEQEKRDAEESLRLVQAQKIDKNNQMRDLQKERELLEEVEASHLEETPDSGELFIHHLRVKRGYETAVETVLGARMQALLRRDLSEALEGSMGKGSYLLYERAGIPDASLQEEDLLSHVEIDPPYVSLLSTLLAGVKVADSLAEVEVSPGEMIVTKDGAFLNGPFLRLSSAQPPLLSFRARREEILEEIFELEKDLGEDKDREERLIAECRHLHRQFEEEVEKRAALLKAIERSDNELRDLRHIGELNDQRVQQLEKKVEADMMRRSELIKQLEDKSVQREDLCGQIDSVLLQELPDNRLLEEDAGALAEEVHRSELVLARSEEILRAAKTNLEEKQRAFEQAMQRQESERSQMQDLRIMLHNLQEEIDQLREQHSVILLSVEEIDSYVIELRKQIAALREERERREREKKDLDERQKTLLAEISALDVKYVRADERRKSVSESIWETYQLSIRQLRERFSAREVQTSRSELRNIRQSMLALEPVNLDAIEEYEQVSEREKFLRAQLDDLQKAREDLHRTLATLERRMRGDFKKTFEEIRGYFQDIFRELFRGGEGDIRLEEDKDVLESDILIYASPPGKKLVHMNLLSGGEKAMTAIALLFAVLRAKPSPFYILDEVEAALDDVNIQRFGEFLKTFSEDSQFILITHRKGTMEYAKALYGVSMEEKGISSLVSINLEEGGSYGRAV